MEEVEVTECGVRSAECGMRMAHGKSAMPRGATKGNSRNRRASASVSEAESVACLVIGEAVGNGIRRAAASHQIGEAAERIVGIQSSEWLVALSAFCHLSFTRD